MSKPRGPRRYDLPRDPATVLRMLRAFRGELGKVQDRVTIQGPIYKAIDAICAKIDDLAGWLTGNREYFWAGSSSATPAQLEYRRRWDAIERGEEEWPRD